MYLPGYTPSVHLPHISVIIPNILNMAGLRDPYLKLSWAKHHLEALDIEIMKFCTPSNAYAITREGDLQNQLVANNPFLPDAPTPAISRQRKVDYNAMHTLI
jgi:hypothetical protein